MPSFERSNYSLHQAMIGHAVCEFNKRMILSCGMDIFGNIFGDVYGAKDGENFELLTTAENRINPARYGHAMAVHDGRIYLTGGTAEVGLGLGDVWSSLNGRNWELLNPNAFPPRYTHAMYSFDKKIWVLGGYHNQQGLSDCWCSSDGVNWQRQVDNYSILNRMAMGYCVFDNKMWFSGGLGGATLTLFRDCYWSIDGKVWNPSQVPADFPALWGHTMTVFDNKMVIIGGSINPDLFGNLVQSTLWFSSNGTDWALGDDDIGFHVMGHAAGAFTPKQKLFIYAGADDNGFRNWIWQTKGDAFRSRAW